jgi:hypothetical protein
MCLEWSDMSIPRTIVSVILHYTNPALLVALVQNEHHYHLMVVLALKQLKKIAHLADSLDIKSKIVFTVGHSFKYGKNSFQIVNETNKPIKRNSQESHKKNQKPLGLYNVQSVSLVTFF